MSGYPTGAQFDKRAPFNRPDVDAREQAEIDRRTDELAVEGFEQRDEFATTFISECPLGGTGEPEFNDFVRAALDFGAAPNSDNEMQFVWAWEKLRDAYVKYGRELYWQIAKDELTTTAEYEP